MGHGFLSLIFIFFVCVLIYVVACVSEHKMGQQAGLALFLPSVGSRDQTKLTLSVLDTEPFTC